MNEVLKQDHDESINKNTDLHTQDEISDMFENSWEYMKHHDISILTALAKHYYETDEKKDYSAYTWEETEVWDSAHLYTLIRYQGKDMIVQLGSGEFNTAVFTKKSIPELASFVHSKLPFFVVNARAESEYKDDNPRQFLNEHASIYSPKWGQAELRITSKQKEHPINYGNAHGIINYPDVLSMLQNALFDKMFKILEKKEKAIKEIANLQKFSKKEFIRLFEMDQKYYTDEQKILFCMLADMVKNEKDDEKMKKMYDVVKAFNVKGLFAHIND